MQTVFIFTHLIMIGAASAVLYFNFEIEPEPGTTNPIVIVLTASVLAVKFRGLRYRVKSCAILIAGRLSGLKNTEPILHESGQTA